MTHEQLSEIDARLRAATPGPWRTDGTLVGSDVINAWIVRCVQPFRFVDGSCVREVVRGPQRVPDNAVFVANAPVDIAALVAEVKRLNEKLDEARHHANHCNDCCGLIFDLVTK